MCSHCTCKNGPSATADHPGQWQLSIKICLKVQRQVWLLATILTKAETCCLCAILCAETSEKKMCQHIWTRRRIEGKLATFTAFNLMANISYTMITEQLLHFFLVVQLRVAMAFRCSVCHFAQAQWGKKRVGRPKFWHVRNSFDLPLAVQERIIGPHSGKRPVWLNNQVKNRLKSCSVRPAKLWLC